MSESSRSRLLWSLILLFCDNIRFLQKNCNTQASKFQHIVMV
jgi:hypothetical protein